MYNFNVFLFYAYVKIPMSGLKIINAIQFKNRLCTTNNKNKFTNVHLKL